MSLKRLLALGVIATMTTSSSLLTMCNPALACGPFDIDAVFTYKLHPDLPLSLYASGEIGIVQPTYARSYLVVAYRYLAGKPLSAIDQAQAIAFWQKRLSQTSMDTPADAKTWFAARDKVLGKNKDNEFFDVYRTPNFADYYGSYLNCPPDAFRTATNTLTERQAKNPDKAWLADFVKNQDAVFCHCRSPIYDYKNNKPGAEPAFPKPAPADAPVWVKQDRAYQIAAANFYAEKLDQALKDFSAIYLDDNSPWQKIAGYMRVRCLIRKATLSQKEGVDKSLLQQAKTEIDLLKQNKRFDGYTNMRQGLADLESFIELRLAPGPALARTATYLSGEGNKSGSFFRHLDDYAYLMDQAFQEDPETPGDQHAVKNVDYKDSFAGADLNEWIRIFSNTNKDLLSVDIETARAKAFSSTPWLICYASKIGRDAPDRNMVIEHLAKVDGPGKTMARYHMLRLSGDNAEGGITLAQLAGHTKAPSSRNAIDLVRLERESDLERFIKLSFASPAALVGSYEARDLPDDYEKTFAPTCKDYPVLKPLLRPEAALQYNFHMPLAMWQSVLNSANLEPSRKADFAQAYFVRASLLGDWAKPDLAATILKRCMPAQAGLLDGYLAAKQTPDKLFAASYFMIKNPGATPLVRGGTPRETDYARIDDFQNNWWGKLEPGKSENTGLTDFNSPVFAKHASTASTELNKINAHKYSVVWLADNILAYAATHPADARIPEALHRIVRATKVTQYEDKNIGRVSKSAFDLLHRNYKGNKWTNETKVHY